MYKKDFKQKYFLLCNDCSNLNSYLCKVGEQKPQEEVRRKRIKIFENETEI